MKFEWSGFDAGGLEKALNAELAKDDGGNEAAVVEAVKRATNKVLGEPMEPTVPQKIVPQLRGGQLPGVS